MNRPDALNALTYQMCLDIDAALRAWATEDAVSLVVIDGTGNRAFCAGGDLTRMYETGRSCDFSYGRQFWRDEYRLNALIAGYPKPFVALMHGFTMGGGVGVSCHGSHRIVCETSQIAMPEVGVGIVPDVGGSLLLARAPGRVGEFLGATGTRMSATDAIYCGFADSYVPQSKWSALLSELQADGTTAPIDAYAVPHPGALLKDHQPLIDACFAQPSLHEIAEALEAEGGEFADKALKALSRASPLAAACGIELVRRARSHNSIAEALATEFRFTYRCMGQGDFLEGIRAAIIDKDKLPRWAHRAFSEVTRDEVTAMLDTLGPAELWSNEDQP